MLLIISFLAWQIVTVAARVSVAAVAIGYGTTLAIRVRNTGRTILTLAPTCGWLPSDFDRKPTRGQRRAMRKHIKLALHQTEFTSLFPDIAGLAKRFAEGSAS